jgi:hypothetical protein
MKLKVVSNYDSDINMYKTMNNCFANNTKFELTTDDQYEYLLIINGYKGKINTTRNKVFGLLQEPIGNINYDRNLHFYCNKIFCQDSSMFNSYSGNIVKPLHMFYSHHVSVSNEYFINFNNFENRKKICLIVSSLNGPNNINWINHNYNKRHKLVQTLLKSNLDFDFYGRGWGGISDNRYKGYAENKHNILRNYQYSICIENVNEHNYVSEKFFDCILNNTVPLYYGCPNIEEIYDSKSYETINIKDDNIVEILKNKISIDSLFYKESILKSKQTYFNNLNIFKLMEKIVNECRV